MIHWLFSWLARLLNWFHPEPASYITTKPQRPIVLEVFSLRRRFTNAAGVEMVELVDQDGYAVYETAAVFDAEYGPIDGVGG